MLWVHPEGFASAWEGKKGHSFNSHKDSGKVPDSWITSATGTEARNKDTIFRKCLRWSLLSNRVNPHDIHEKLTRMVQKLLPTETSLA